MSNEITEESSKKSTSFKARKFFTHLFAIVGATSFAVFTVMAIFLVFRNEAAGRSVEDIYNTLCKIFLAATPVFLIIAGFLDPEPLFGRTSRSNNQNNKIEELDRAKVVDVKTLTVENNNDFDSKNETIALGVRQDSLQTNEETDGLVASKNVYNHV